MYNLGQLDKRLCVQEISLSFFTQEIIQSNPFIFILSGFETTEPFRAHDTNKVINNKVLKENTNICVILSTAIIDLDIITVQENRSYTLVVDHVTEEGNIFYSIKFNTVQCKLDTSWHEPEKYQGHNPRYLPTYEKFAAVGHVLHLRTTDDENVIHLLLHSFANEYPFSSSSFSGVTSFVNLEELPQNLFDKFTYYVPNAYKRFRIPKHETPVQNTTFRLTHDMKYTFGCEIETTTTPLIYRDVISKKLRLNCFRDGSVSGAGTEYVTGVLSGDTGIYELKNIYEAIFSSEYVERKMDTSASLHVHIGGAIFNKELFASLFTLALRTQTSFLSMFPKFRTVNNKYCKGYDIKKVESSFLNTISRYERKLLSYENLIDSLHELFIVTYFGAHNYRAEGTKKVFCTNSDGDATRWNLPYRRTAINFVPTLFRRNPNTQNVLGSKDKVKEEDYTVEFRVHEPTSSFDAAYYFVLLCMAFVRYAEQKKLYIMQSLDRISIDVILRHTFSGKELQKMRKYVAYRKALFATTNDLPEIMCGVKQFHSEGHATSKESVQSIVNKQRNGQVIQVKKYSSLHISSITPFSEDVLVSNTTPNSVTQLDSDEVESPTPPTNTVSGAYHEQCSIIMNLLTHQSCENMTTKIRWHSEQSVNYFENRFISSPESSDILLRKILRHDYTVVPVITPEAVYIALYLNGIEKYFLPLARVPINESVSDIPLEVLAYQLYSHIAHRGTEYLSASELSYFLYGVAEQSVLIDKHSLRRIASLICTLYLDHQTPVLSALHLKSALLDLLVEIDMPAVPVFSPVTTSTINQNPF